ncbi:zinc-binding dehydrogenase [Comamonas sp.]|uniref:zinc-binding dehydrogenase n=1 Tax=Comamonas sp. TaxID=34028 RepID=UPI00289D9820|nr:zinc-binding dehydrogenase [Comamonas sp.]
MMSIMRNTNCKRSRWIGMATRAGRCWQLREIAALIESGAIRPVVDRVFPFGCTPEALASVGAGHAVIQRQ